MDEFKAFTAGGYTYHLSDKSSLENINAHTDLLQGQFDGVISLLRSGHEIDPEVRETLAQMFEGKGYAAYYRLEAVKTDMTEKAEIVPMARSAHSQYDLYIGYVFGELGGNARGQYKKAMSRIRAMFKSDDGTENGTPIGETAVKRGWREWKAFREESQDEHLVRYFARKFESDRNQLDWDVFGDKIPGD